MASNEMKGIDSEQALSKLKEGNARFVSGKVTHPDQSAERRQELTAGQRPFAIVVGCSDSRVATEVLFDQGLGDIFVVRTAGQVIDDVAFGSIEYAVEHLGVNLIVVLGHDSCGAVKATVDGGEAPGHLGSLIKFILPAVDEARKASSGSELLNKSIDNNVKNIVALLKTNSPLLAPRVQKGGLKIIGARYHLDSGLVEFNP
jgi:carbonic anhydrase